MSFSIKSSQIDLGQTPIENLFIHDFMPMANGTFVKVYLLGYYFAKRNDSKFSNETLAKHLDIAIEDVVSAWLFWEKKGIVTCSAVAANHSEHQFDVTFLSIRDIFIKNNYGKIEVAHTETKQLKTSDKLLSAMSNPMIKKMLTNIQFSVRRMLTPQETNRVLDWMTNYKMDPDMIERAFHITYEDRKVSGFQFEYVEGIIRKWYDNRIFTTDDLENHLAENNERYTLYKRVFQSLGGTLGTVPEGIKETIDIWCDIENYTEDYILYVAKEATKRTLNPSINYLNSIFENIKSKGVSTISGAKMYFDAHRGKKVANKSKGGKKTPFQNFSQSTISSLSKEDIQKIIKRKSNKKTGEDHA